MGVPIALGYKEDDASGAQVIDGGLRFDSSKNQRLRRTPSSAGNRKTFTLSVWVKRNTLDSGDRDDIFTVPIGSNDNDYFQFGFYQDSLYMFGYSTLFRIVSPKYRDTSGWYHIVLAADTTQADNLDRMKFYVNGIRVTNFSTNNAITQNADLGVNRVAAHDIGYQNDGYPYSGYMSQFYLIDGQALDPSYFGYTDPLTNTWRPKKFKPQATPNDGRTWDSTLSSSTSVTTPENAFNGNLSDSAYVTGGITFTPPSFMSAAGYVRSCRFYSESFGQGGTITLNGTQVESNYDFGNGKWYSFDMASVNYTLTSFKWDRQPGSGSNNNDYIAAIEINGVILLNGDTTNMGTNAFYLPFDGSAPIGQDQSGRGNNWTPVNFGGSNTIEKATGALPILNTDGGGKVARVGVRTDAFASNLVLATPLVGIASDFSNKINSGTTEKVMTVSGATANTASNFYGGSYKFVAASSQQITTPGSSDFAFGTGDFCVECWYYNDTSGGGTTYNQLVGNIESATAGFWRIGSVFAGGNQFWFTYTNGNYNDVFTNININDGRWHHLAATRESGTLRLFVDGVVQATATVTQNFSQTTTLRMMYSAQQPGYANGYLQDVRIYKGTAKYTQNFIPASTDPDILPDTPSGVSYSSNVALVPSTDGAVAFDGSGDYLSLADNADFTFGTGDLTVEAFVYPTSSSDGFIFDNRNTSGSPLPGIGFGVGSNTPRLLLTGAGPILTASQSLSNNIWHHVAVVKSSGTFYIYINGVQSGSTADSTNLTSSSAYVGGAYGGGSNYFPGFISNLRITKGTALYTSNFTPPTAPITSVANTKLLCCKSNSSATAFDVSPGTITANGDAKATNFNPFTVNINTQRGQESGYATLNPLFRGATGATYSNGNLSCNTGNANGHVRGNIGITTGKYYFEAVGTANVASAGMTVGIVQDASTPTYNIGGDGLGYGYLTDGTKANSGWTSYGSSWTTGDIIGVAFDATNGTLTFYKNGVSQGVAFTGLFSSPYFPAVSDTTSGDGVGFDINFGQKPFKFPPPAGFQPLALANTPRPTIVRPDQYVGVATYTGNGSTKSINVGFKPDLIWIKQRNDNTANHVIWDSVRGTGVDKDLSSNTANYEGRYPNYANLVSINRDGFSLGTTTNYNNANTNNINHVAWAWKAGGNSNTFNINDIGYSTASAAGLTAGTITLSGASVNTKSGFGVYTWSGTGANGTIAHGLQNAPKFMMFKGRDTAYNWRVYHTSLGATKALILNSTNTPATSSGYFNDTEPTSTVFTVGTNDEVNGITAGTQRMIAYCWAEIPGFSKFGTYTGNASGDGPMIVTGFRPRWIIVRRTDTTGNWVIVDTIRDPYNYVNSALYADLSYTEAEVSTGPYCDCLSNGFKVRTSTYGNWNANGGTYVYAAFAEAPSFNLYGGQANAR